MLAVLCFHAQFTWASGGFLGVSTFFTLSGFLITTLLLQEQRRDGRIDLGAFWSRRFRRLLPASMLTLFGVVLFATTVAGPSQLATLRGDVVAALAYLANWRFVADSNSYADLFTAPSPVLHFWSLAIEEQYYLLFPLVTVAGLRATGGDRRRMGLVFAGLAAASLAATLLLSATGAAADRIYYGTDTRVFELLVGSLLAVALLDERARRVVTRVAPVLGAVALVVVVVLWSTVDLTTAFLYEGGFALYGVLSVAVVAAAVAPSGVVRSALAVEPLRQLGRISYGVYLFHWPIFLWLTEARTGWSQLPLFGLRVAVTVAVAIVSFVLVEQPIRRRRVLAVDRQALLVAPAAAAVLVVALGAVTVDIPGPPIDFATAAAEAEELIEGEGAPTTGCLGVEPAAPQGEPPRLAVAGDSTALMMNIGLATWGRCTGLIRSVGATHAFGCGVGTGGSKFFRGADREMVGSWKGDPVPDGTCREWRDQFDEAFGAVDADAMVVEFGPPDLTDRRLEGSDETVRLGDPVYDDYLRGALDEFVTEVSEFVPRVIWLLSPPERPLVDGSPPVPPYPESDPARTEAYNDLIRELPDRHPQVTVIDLGPWFEQLPGGVFDVEARPDGVHLAEEQSVRMADEYLGTLVLEAIATQ